MIRVDTKSIFRWSQRRYSFYFSLSFTKRMAKVWCSACFCPENENEMVSKKIVRLREMVEKLSSTHLNNLVAHIEDGLNDIDSANPQQKISGTADDSVDALISSTDFGRDLVNYLINRIGKRTCKVCILQKLGYDARKVVTAVLNEAHKIRWVAGGLSVAAYMMGEMKKSPSGRSVYVQPLLYMFGLLEYIRQQNEMKVEQQMLNDIVHFIVMGSLLCIIRMQTKNHHGFLGLSASVSKADIHNLEFRLGSTYPDLALGKIMEKFPSAILLSPEQQYVNAGAVGTEKARDEVIRLLGVDSDNRSVIAVVIYGQDGIGKTTIAKAVFDRMQLRDHDVSRVEINHNSEHDIKLLQQQLLYELFGKNIVLGSCVEGRAHLSNAFRDASCPVFIFIDNVQRDSDIDNLLPGEVKWLPIKSKILITSRDPLQLRRIQHHHYSVKRLEDTEAKKFLRKGVLGSVDATFSPKVDIDRLTRMCDGIPLGLRLVASYLCQNGDHISACKDLLESVKQHPMAESKICCSIVDFIYNRLEGPYKEAFLDIAIFFNNWDRHKLVYTFPDIQLKVLEEAALVTISPEGKLFVHDVVREQATTLSQKARITEGQGLKKALLDKSSLSKIKGVWLSEEQCEFQLEAGDLDLMHKSLRVLYLGKSIQVSGECKSTFEEVRFFHIHNKHDLPMDLHNFKRAAFFHGSLKKGIHFLDLKQSFDLLEASGVSDLTKFPPGLQLAKFLRVVELSDSSDLDRLPQGFNFFSSLEELDLSNCVNLIDLPDWLSQLKSLCKLKLTACSSLKTLPETLGDLSSLEEMDCTDCFKLVRLPDSFSQLQFLCYLQLRGCSQLLSLPENFGSLCCLKELDLSDCKKLGSLPVSFQKLNSLSHLHLQGCSELNALPKNIGKLSALEELDLSSDDKLESLDSSFGQLERLRSLQLQGCSNLISLATNIGNLSSLEELDLTGCDKLRSLPETFGKLNSLRVLKLCCSKLTTLPVSMGNMSSLQQLTLTNCDKLARIPNTFCQLKSIYRMNLKSCPGITEIPLPSLEELEMTDCNKLIKLPDNIEQHHHSLRVLKLYGCSTLPELPPMFGKLPSVEDLVLNDCKNLMALPDSFSQLKSLRHLRLRGGSKLTMDSIAAFPSSLETVDLGYCSSLQSLPQGFGQHKHLILLLMDGCSRLSVLPDGFGGLNSLKYLSIAGCTELQELSADFVNLTSLEAINASSCRALQGPVMDKLVDMKQLKFADIRESFMLINRWKETQGRPLLVLCSDTEPEAIYAEAIVKTRVPSRPMTSSRKALVWLTMYDPDGDQHTSEIMRKADELKSRHYPDFMRVDLWESDAATVVNDGNMCIFKDPKICQTLAYAILGWWNLRHPGLFATLAMLHTFLVMIDIQMLAAECKLHMEAILPAFQNGGYQDVDLQRWVDPKGGFRRIFSPFVPLISESFLKNAE